VNYTEKLISHYMLRRGVPKRKPLERESDSPFKGFLLIRLSFSIKEVYINRRISLVDRSSLYLT
jgi:hypothetical protein